MPAIQYSESSLNQLQPDNPQLAFKSAHKHHLELEQKLQDGADLSIQADNELPYSQLKYVFILFLIVFVAWLVYELVSDDEVAESGLVTSSEPTTVGTGTDGTSAELDHLHQQAQAALESNDLSAAAALFQQILTKDAYDGTALSGLKLISDRWQEQLKQTIDEQNQSEGFRLLEALRSIDATNPALAALEQQLQALADTEHREAGEPSPADQQEQPTTEPVAEMHEAQETNAVAVDPTLSQIDTSLETDPDHLLVQGEAYRLLVAKAKENEMSAEYQNRMERLQTRLQSHADKLITEQKLAEAKIFSNTLKSAGVFEGIAASLDTEIKNRETRQAPTNPQVFAANTKIVPAIRISGPKPRYPRNAERRGIEGFVELEFTISASGSVEDVLVMRSEPEGVFEESAIRALSNWRYQPRLIDDTPVSETKQIRMVFHL